MLSAAERQQVVDALYNLLLRYRLWITEPNFGRQLNAFIAQLIRRWRVYPSQ